MPYYDMNAGHRDQLGDAIRWMMDYQQREKQHALHEKGFGLTQQQYSDSQGEKQQALIDKLHAVGVDTADLPEDGAKGRWESLRKKEGAVSKTQGDLSRKDLASSLETSIRVLGSRYPEFGDLLGKAGISGENVDLGKKTYAELLAIQHRLGAIQQRYISENVPTSGEYMREISKIDHHAGQNALREYDSIERHIQSNIDAGFMGEKQSAGLLAYLNKRRESMETDDAVDPQLRRNLALRNKSLKYPIEIFSGRDGTWAVNAVTGEKKKIGSVPDYTAFQRYHTVTSGNNAVVVDKETGKEVSRFKLGTSLISPTEPPKEAAKFLEGKRYFKK